MKKILLLSLFLLTMLSWEAAAQARTITGRVTDATNNEGLPGVTVLVKGTQAGTATDVSGNYSINVPEGGTTLVFSFVGYTTTERIIGNATTININLGTDARQLNEVVVTALGIAREEKTLGYAASTIKSEDVTQARPNNVMSGIQGKVPGVAISSSGSPGASTKVIIRGVSSFTGGNNPLYVVDGVPINNINYNNANTGSNVNQSTRAVDFGNQANDINPEDVESVTVLKGASATALYGSRAAHGVIMITTKRGKLNDRVRVSYSGAYTASNVLRTVQTQNVFGQGWPLYDPHENGSWGPRLDGVVRTWGAEVDGEARRKPFAYAKDNTRNFFETGSEVQNSVTVSGGGQNNAFAFSYANTNQNGAVPTDVDKYTRNNFSFRGNSNYGKFTSDYNIAYTRRDVSAIFTGQGTSDGGATVFQEIQQIPVDVPISQLKDLNNPYNTPDNYFTVYAENPYFVINNNKTTMQEDRVFGKLELGYEVFKGTKAIVRAGGDFNNARFYDQGARITYTPGSYGKLGGQTDVPGRYGETTRRDQQLDMSALLQGNYTLNEDITLGGIVGGNYNSRSYNTLTSYVTGLNVPEWYSLQNTSGTPVTESFKNERALLAAFGNIDFGFRDYWFVNLSLRNDWSSTLPKGNNSYFYWGANTSLVLSELLPNFQSDRLSFLKVRGAWGKTGNDAAPYLVNSTYPATQISLGFGNIYLPVGGVAGQTQSNNQGNQTLRPEITREWELGLDTRWFESRVGLDVSYYDRQTKDQIVSATVAPETGFTTQTRNIGNIANRGVEARLSLIPVKTDNFQWEFATNFTKNKSEVLSLYGDAKEFLITSVYSVDYVAEVGQPLGTFKVPAFRTVQSGPMAGKVIVQSNGVEATDATLKETVGTSNPDFILGFSNGFTYKGISLNAVVDWRKGGQFYSYTKQLNNFVGNSTETTYNYRQPFVVPNSVKEILPTTPGGEVTYVENDIPVPYTSVYNYWSNASPARFHNFILDRDYVKLREVVLSYNLPVSLVSKAKMSGASISLIGRNLLLFTPKSNNFVDPEATNYGNDISSELGEFAAFPTMRNYGVSLRVTF
ncbi:SusC/RagA family TonB-linked outer membrane protein [Adhaeribacter rhizoryzae]|uniref:SusC/RagA family TonB-linked outer membrane protein n=1 Tax=Adhaeribacter rhizoryzae TaxID=2607907 RepID=A0A5M6DQF1_9BACT|nr:SusC/RagA family TonB-linked outer membrane protein [Adhaeribacter rhizoryzae]KAA5548576.1 SusC/RagA family TonB-linked outer membrane protein [Adhaeribacter rhizoryzae]